MSTEIPLKERYEASMVLSGAGGAHAYNHGYSTFERDEHIHRPHRRRPGTTCMFSCEEFEDIMKGGDYMPFNRMGGGLEAMRAICIGLRFPDPEQERHLVAASIESGWLTHHHPTGYLGGLAAALFTAYAVRGSPPVEAWGHGLMEVLDKAKDYIREAGHCVERNLQRWDHFKESWESYLTERGILDGKAEKARFPRYYGVCERGDFYKHIRSTGRANGQIGHVAPMIAYDALLWAGDSWEKLVDHGFYHYEEKDPTLVIAAAWWGAIYGFRGVPERNHNKLKYWGKLVTVAQKLFELRNKPVGAMNWYSWLLQKLWSASDNGPSNRL